MTKVAFIGLGVMGYPMAGHIARNNHDMVVFNRTKAKAEAWVDDYGGALAETPRAAAEGADFVFSCVGNDHDLREVTLGADGAFNSMKPGSIFIDNTTASADIARELASQASARSFAVLDAPVSGGQAGAENGALTVMVGGDPDVFEKALPVIDCYARAVSLMGPVGSGQLTKMVNQICIAGLVQGLAEALNFASASGLDAKAVIAAISKGAAQSWQMENRYETMVDDHYDHGFAVDWMRKDLRICIEEASRIGASLPVTALVDQFYADVQAMGGGRWDTSSLLRRLKALTDRTENVG